MKVEMEMGVIEKLLNEIDTGSIVTNLNIIAYAGMLKRLMDKCQYQQIDGTCGCEKNMTPECNVQSCPFCGGLK